MVAGGLEGIHKCFNLSALNIVYIEFYICVFRKSICYAGYWVEWVGIDTGDAVMVRDDKFI